LHIILLSKHHRRRRSIIAVGAFLPRLGGAAIDSKPASSPQALLQKSSLQKFGSYQQRFIPLARPIMAEELA